MANTMSHQTLIHRNPRNSQATKTTPRRRKQAPPATKKKPLVTQSPAAKLNLVMGQVKILKRGETLTPIQDKENIINLPDYTRRSNLIVSSINRLGPEPEMMQKQIGAFKELEIVSADYAGSGTSVSPPASSLPFPSFLDKK